MVGFAVSDKLPKAQQKVILFITYFIKSGNNWEDDVLFPQFFFCKLSLMASSEIFWNLGHKITGHNLYGSRSMGYRLFRAFFGTTPQVCEIIWHMLSTRRPPHSTPHHFLWVLLLLKQYNNLAKSFTANSKYIHKAKMTN